MAISNKDGQILQHVVRYCNQIDTTKKFFNLDKADFENNFFMQNALVMPIAQIGELVKKNYRLSLRRTTPKYCGEKLRECGTI